MKTTLTLAAALLAATSYAAAHERHQPTAEAATADQEQTDKQKRTDALLVAAQKICPVTGMDLQVMGEPYKAKAGDKTVFLCCKSCLGKTPKSEAAAQIQKNLIAAQGICPIMKKPLPENPGSTVLDGRTVFVCCKGCVAKVKADPKKTLAVIDAQLAKHKLAEEQRANRN